MFAGPYLGPYDPLHVFPMTLLVAYVAGAALKRWKKVDVWPWLILAALIVTLAVSRRW